MVGLCLPVRALGNSKNGFRDNFDQNAGPQSGERLTMPRRSILSAAERDSLLSLPDSEDELIRQYTFSEPDLSLIRQRRGDANRLGVAVQLCLLRFPGQGL
jgi:TnpA family transposase